MANLAHEPVKPLDRLKIPPWLIYSCVFSVFAFFVVRTSNEKGLNIEQLRRENMLKAMRSNRENLLYDTKKEITPAEQVEMKSKQYKQVVRAKQQKEKETLA